MTLDRLLVEFEEVAKAAPVIDPRASLKEIERMKQRHAQRKIDVARRLAAEADAEGVPNG